MKDYNEDPLHKLIGRSTYICIILPTISAIYYHDRLHDEIEALKQREDIDVEFGERENNYLEIKVKMKGKKEYTTDWDVLMERIEDIKELEKENCELRSKIRTLENYIKRN